MTTELGRDHDEEMLEAIGRTSAYWKTPDEGSSTTLVAALDPKLSGKISGSRVFWGVNMDDETRANSY